MKKYMSYAAAVLFLLSFSLTSDAQCLQGDCSNGYGKFRYRSGAIYEGDFRQGKSNGKGILTFTNGNKYLGDWQDSHRQGQGKLLFREGHTYVGGFVKSKMRGKGIMRYVNGDSYDGDWENDRPNGSGAYSFNNGDRYEGNFANGSFDGEGTMFYGDGSRYEGLWQESKKHGNGTLHLNTGEVQFGKWTAGQRTDAVPTEMVNSTVNSRPSASSEAMSSSLARDCNTGFCSAGLGTYQYADGSIFRGSFRNGEPSGKGLVLYSNGDKYEGMWLNHAPHGQGVMYYQSGRVLGAVFQEGQILAETQPTESTYESKQVAVARDPQVRIWSVVVGVGKYSHMPTLNYTDDDAYQIYAFLKSPQGGSLPDERLRVLVDEDATRSNILRSMREVLLKADENDVVLFYFSGHGLEGSFLPVDYDGYNNRIRYDEIKGILNESRAKHKMVFADACYSGGLLAAKSPNSEPIKIYTDAFNNTKGGLALMMSSKREEVSLEDGGLRSGVFSHYLVRGLKGEADRDMNDLVTITELFDFVNLKVRRYTSDAQNPTISGNFDREMPVAVVK